MDVKIDETWKSKLNEEFNKEYFIRLAEFIREEYRVIQSIRLHHSYSMHSICVLSKIPGLS